MKLRRCKNWGSVSLTPFSVSWYRFAFPREVNFASIKSMHRPERLARVTGGAAQLDLGEPMEITLCGAVVRVTIVKGLRK
jgi:hypothetical protein